MFTLLRRRLGGLNRILRLVSVFAAVAMWLTGRSRKTTTAATPEPEARTRVVDQ